MKLRDLARQTLATLALALALSPSATFAEGEVKSNAWSKVKTPADGAARPIGQYTSGCIQGAAELPLDGAGYQVMHPSRLRYFGHPNLVSFIQDLGKSVKTAQLGDVMVGDLSQPRGGPAPGGHSSHQTGLDVDLWFWQPDQASKRPLTVNERESIKARSVLDPKTSGVQTVLSLRVLSLLQKTAEDARVERIFVNPMIKRDACKAASGDRNWLRKVRPWYGHDDHFHVRLECPTGSADCNAQTPTPRGDGCGAELDWWFSPEAKEDRKKGQATYQAKVGKAPGMPAECTALLGKPGRASALAKTTARKEQVNEPAKEPEASAASDLSL